MKLNHKSQSGRSMIEMLGVLAIIGVLSVAGIAGYSKAMEKARQNRTINAITHLVANIQTLYAKQSTYDELNNQVAINVGLVPDTLIVSGSDITTVYGGTITIVGDASNFSVKVEGLPKELALLLSTSDWNSGGNLMQIKVGSED